MTLQWRTPSDSWELGSLGSRRLVRLLVDQVDPPDVQGRYEILKVHAKGKNLAPGVDLLAVARQTPGMSGVGPSKDGVGGEIVVR